MFNPWFDLCVSAFEAQQVIWLRTLQIAGGGRLAETEANRMITEKVEAAAIAGTLVATGSADKVAGMYQRKSGPTKSGLLRNGPLASAPCASSSLTMSVAFFSTATVIGRPSTASLFTSHHA
ncbi:MAG: hypothetical protein EOR60_31160 [Mesorhizobium sp.]|nr:MAG: hypothetical protein EOR60_31160 [Mesorhizobium sp.]